MVGGLKQEGRWGFTRKDKCSLSELKILEVLVN